MLSKTQNYSHIMSFNYNIPKYISATASGQNSVHENGITELSNAKNKNLNRNSNSAFTYTTGLYLPQLVLTLKLKLIKYFLNS